MAQVVQMSGVLLILIAFGLAQWGVIAARGAPSLGLNLAGALVLGVSAYSARQWGFLVLEVAWALISAAGLARLRSRPVPI